MSATKKTKLPPKVEDMTKEEIIFFLKKKRDCEATALSIVVKLLENEVNETSLLNCLPFISQNHFDDVIEERSITKLCGYPLCSKSLPDKQPSQQYMISNKTNKVYDITTRKKHCSNVCYKASVHIKEQISSTPIWCRDNSDVPNFNLLPLEIAKGIIGEEVQLSMEKIETDETKEQSFNSFFDFTEASLNEIALDKDGKNVAIESVKITKKRESNAEGKLDIIPEDEEIKNSVNVEEKVENVAVEMKSEIVLKPTTLEEKIEESRQIKNKLKSNKGKILGEIVERKSENKMDPMISAGQKMEKDKKVNVHLEKRAKKREPKPLSLAIIHIEKCLGEWFSLETILFIFGEERVKQMVSDKGECIKEYLNNMANGLLYKSTSYDQYQILCRKLNLLELEDRRYDNKVTSAKVLKPLPHYSMLQEESERMDLKVRAFLKGDMEIPAKKTKAISNSNTEPIDDEPLTNIPLIDKTAQHALRRKIVLNALNKVLPDLLQTLGLTSREVNSDVHLLVATLNLQAHNITFRPAQWSMIAMIIIKLLSIRDVKLKKALERDLASRHLQLLLMSYEQDGGYLDRFILWLTDIDRLLDSDVKQLTVVVK